MPLYVIVMLFIPSGMHVLWHFLAVIYEKFHTILCFWLMFISCKALHTQVYGQGNKTTSLLRWFAFSMFFFLVKVKALVR